MELKELRVGNVVAVRHHRIDDGKEERRVIKVRSLGTNASEKSLDEDEDASLHQWVVDTNAEIHDITELYPVDLTVNIMKRLRFKSDPVTSTMTMYNDRMSVVYDRTDNTLTILKHRRPIFEKYVDYVHELQNVLELFGIEVNVTTDKMYK